ncbi:MAG: hypothetical protein AAAC47_18260, partial [Pararhizobium sp.]
MVAVRSKRKALAPGEEANHSPLADLVRRWHERVRLWRERITEMRVMIEEQSHFQPFGLPYWGSQDLNK